MALATLVMSQLFHVFDARAEEQSFLEVGLFTNPWAVGAVLSSIAMLLAIVYIPSLGELFKTDPIGWADWALVILASGFVQLIAAIRDIVFKPMRHIIPSSQK